MPIFPFIKRRTAEPRSIIFIGLAGSGKSTFFRKLLNQGDELPPPPTIAYHVLDLAWKNATYTLVDIGGDALDHRGNHAKSLLFRRESIVFYLHDCSVDGNFGESARALHEHAQDMMAAGVRHLWVILNKQDLLRGHQKGYMTTARELFEQELTRYCDRLLCRIVDLPGTSGLTGHRLDDVMDLVAPAFSSKFKPNVLGSECNRLVLRQFSHFSFFPDDDRYGRLSSDEFWKRIQETEPVLTAHGTRVRAAYFIMLESLQNKRDIFETATANLTNPWLQFDHSRVGNRTMLIFYLHQVEVSIRRICRNLELPLPGRDDFAKVVKYNAYNLTLQSWANHYTDAYMSAPLTAALWRPPNIRELEPVKPASFCLMDPYYPPPSPAPPARQTRAARFAFLVVRTYLSDDGGGGGGGGGAAALPRSRVVELALSVFQQATQRLRSTVPAPAAAPYSETQLYFWIVYMHAKLAPLPAGRSAPGDDDGLLGREDVTFDALLRNGLVHAREWQAHYSRGLWESVGARIAVAAPDLAMLHKIGGGPLRRSDVNEAVEAVFTPEIAGDEELGWRKAYAMLWLREVPGAEASLAPRNHAELLFCLFWRLSGHERLRDLAGCVEDVVSGLKVQSRSHAVYARLMRSALLRELAAPARKMKQQVSMLEPFERLLANNMHLLQEDLTDYRAMRLEEQLGGGVEPAWRVSNDDLSSRLSYATLTDDDEKRTLAADDEKCTLAEDYEKVSSYDQAEDQSILDEQEWDVVTITGADDV